MNIILSIIKFLTIAYPVLFVLISILCIGGQLFTDYHNKKHGMSPNGALIMLYGMGILPIFFVTLPVELVFILILTLV